MTYFVGRGERDLDESLAEVDLIITGPHALRRLPGRDAALRRREADQAVAVRLHRHLDEPGHPSLGADRPARPLHRGPAPTSGARRQPRPARRPHPGLREAFARLDAGGPDGRPSLVGVDAVRPVTFGYLPVYKRPQTDEDWDRLGDALRRAGALGIDEYERVRDDLIERVIEAKLRRLATHRPGIVHRRRLELRHPPRRHVDARHDEPHRPTRRRHLPRTPTRGPAPGRRRAVQPRRRRRRARTRATPPRCGTRPRCRSMRPERLRTIGRAYQIAFDAWGPDDVAYNRPYVGGHETRTLGPKLRTLEPLAVVRPRDGITRRLRFGVWQNEFLREFLLGPEAAADAGAAGDRLAPATGRPRRVARRAPAPRARPRPQLGPRTRELTGSGATTR